MLAKLVNTAFHQVFSPIVTISITFPMQMDFNLPNVLLPKFFTVQCIAIYIYILTPA